MAKAEFSESLLQSSLFSITIFFGNNSNMLIFSSRNISWYQLKMVVLI